MLSASTPRRTSVTELIVAAMSCPQLQRREQRLAKIREAKLALEAEAAERERARRAELAEQGKTPRQPPNGRDPFKPKPKAQRNFTDPESKIMKSADGAFHQCFNGQAIVDSQAQVIVAAEISDEAPDARQLQPALEQLDENLDEIDAELPQAAALTADAGYFSEENIRIASEHGLDPHIATGRFKHSEPSPPAPRGPVPKNATAKQRMARKLKTKEGRATYARRKAIVEPVFGQMQTVQDARQLLLARKVRRACPMAIPVRHPQPPKAPPQRRTGPNRDRMIRPRGRPASPISCCPA